MKAICCKLCLVKNVSKLTNNEKKGGGSKCQLTTCVFCYTKGYHKKCKTWWNEGGHGKTNERTGRKRKKRTCKEKVLFFVKYSKSSVKYSKSSVKFSKRPVKYSKSSVKFSKVQ